MFWARSFSNVSSPVMDFFERLAQTDTFENNAQSSEESVESDGYETTAEVITTTTEKPKRTRKPKMKRDLSAGQFYSGLVETLS